jgi:hypothetical protein
VYDCIIYILYYILAYSTKLGCLSWKLQILVKVESINTKTWRGNYNCNVNIYLIKLCMTVLYIFYILFLHIQHDGDVSLENYKY